MIHVGVLFGGRSTEHEVSRRSAATILGAMPKEYKKTPVGITKTGVWYAFFGDESEIPGGEWEKSDKKRMLFFAPNGLFYEENGNRVPLDIDVVFPVLHGMYGEDGTLQGLLEMLKIPYVGCGVAASANAMDKSMTKLLVSTAGIRQADFVFVDGNEKRPYEEIADACEKKFGYPCFIKPCRSGSSVGVVKATCREELIKGLDHALAYDNRLLIEEGIDARELECAVLSACDKTVAEVGEVISAVDYYDYDAKYNNAASITELYPDISRETEEEIKRKAITIFRLLDCKGLARVDFFLDRKSGEVVFNEINTLPGFTSISMYPMLMEKHGIDKATLVDLLIRESLKKEII